jgi:hypothetical protein
VHSRHRPNGTLTCHRRLSEPLTPQTFLFRPTSKRASSFNGFQLHHHTDQTDKIVPEEKNGPSRDLTKPPEWIIPARRQVSPDPCWSITKTVVMPYADRFHASLIPFSILTPVPSSSLSILLPTLLCSHLFSSFSRAGP